MVLGFGGDVTTPAQPCIRGCTFPGRLMDDGTQGEAEPRPAKQGLLCTGCARRLETYLEEIPDMYATLDSRPEGAFSTRYDGRSGGKKGGISYSPALARLDVIALQDPRTVAYSLADPETGKHYHDGLMDVAGVLVSWATMFAEEQHVTSPTGTLWEAVDLLVRWFDRLTEQLWVDEMWTDVHDADQLLRRANGRPAARPRGHCQKCASALWGEADAVQITCNKCRITYTGAQLLLIADSREQAEKGLGVG